MDNPTHPFIEMEVVSTQIPKRELLSVFQTKSQKRHYAHVSWKGVTDNPILRVDYDSYDHFQAGYTRENIIYENFVNLANLQDFSLKKLHHVPASNNGSMDEIYAILKYTTNFKAPMRENYQFVFSIMRMVGLGASFEEVQDGFILFYQTKEDFDAGQVDLLDTPNVIAWLKRYHLFTPELAAFLEQFQKSLASKDISKISDS